MSGRITRSQLEKAVVELAWDIFIKGPKFQYDSQELNRYGGTTAPTCEPLSKFFGGAFRTSENSAPEYATSQSTVCTVCSDFVWNVFYQALGFPMFGYRLNALTAGYWMFGKDYPGFVLAYYNRKFKGPDDNEFDCGVSRDKMMSVGELRGFARDWKHNLRVGDVMCSAKHTMLYIGNGLIIDSGGGKYSMTTGEDTFERLGTVAKIHRLEDIAIDGTDPVIGSRYVISDTSPYSSFYGFFRPLNLICTDEKTGNPADDFLDENARLPENAKFRIAGNVKRDGFGILPSTVTRLNNPLMEIDRGSTLNPFNSAVIGDEIGYHITVSNMSDIPEYTDFRRISPELYPEDGKLYCGADYRNLTITENVPDGCELTEIPAGASFDGKTLKWTVDIPAGCSVTKRYRVHVTDKAGAFIVSGGGYVGDIPSNVLENPVAERHLSKTFLAGLAYPSADTLKEKCGVLTSDSPTRFIEKAYIGLGGEKLVLPDVAGLLNGLFEFREMTFKGGFHGNKNKTAKASMYCLREKVAPEMEIYRKMLVPGFIGGVMVYTDRFADRRINEMRPEYMERGDILISVRFVKNIDLTRERPIATAESSLMMTRDKTAVKLEDGSYTINHNDRGLWRTLCSDVFFCLRPANIEKQF